MKGLCHACLASSVEVERYEGQILCKSCLSKKVNKK